MDFIPAPADPERQALPDDPGACLRCGACAWHCNGTYARDLVVLGRLQVQRWQCKACLGSASPLPPGVTARQRPQAFRGLVRLLDPRGCGVGAATLWRDVQAVAPGLAPDPQAKLPSWVEVDETWLSLGGAKRPVAVVLGPKGTRLDLRLSGPGFNWGGWFTDLAARQVQGVTTDDDPVYGPAQPRHPCFLHASVRQGQTQEGGPRRRHAQAAGDAERHHAGPGAVARKTCHKVDPYLTFNTVTGPGPAAHPATLGPRAATGGRGRPVGALESDDAGPRTPAAGGAQAAVAPHGTRARAGAQPGEPQGACLHQPVGGLVWTLQAPGAPGTGAEDRAEALNFVRLMARSMA